MKVKQKHRLIDKNIRFQISSSTFKNLFFQCFCKFHFIFTASLILLSSKLSFQTFIALSCLFALVMADGQLGVDFDVAPGYQGPIGPLGLGAGVGPLGPGPFGANRPYGSGPIGINRPIGPVGPVPIGAGPLPLGAGALLGAHRPYGPGPIGPVGLASGFGHEAPLPAPIRPTPIFAPGPAYGTGPVIADGPAQYQFAYGVQTDGGYHGPANFGHNEQRNGYTTSGQYHVELPGHSSQSISYTVGPAGPLPYGPAPIGPAPYGPSSIL